MKFYLPAADVREARGKHLLFCSKAGRILSAVRPSLFVSGWMRQHDTPDWKSLEELLASDELCAHFMWLHDVVLDGGTILNVYKHCWPGVTFTSPMTFARFIT